jgi:hypothetical protein
VGPRAGLDAAVKRNSQPLPEHEQPVAHRYTAELSWFLFPSGISTRISFFRLSITRPVHLISFDLFNVLLKLKIMKLLLMIVLPIFIFFTY